MRKYSVPTIRITKFLVETVCSGSEIITQYIEEVEGLQRLLGDTNEQYRARIVSFKNVINFTN